MDTESANLKRILLLLLLTHWLDKYWLGVQRWNVHVFSCVCRCSYRRNILKNQARAAKLRKIRKI